MPRPTAPSTRAHASRMVALIAASASFRPGWRTVPGPDRHLAPSACQGGHGHHQRQLAARPWASTPAGTFRRRSGFPPPPQPRSECRAVGKADMSRPTSAAMVSAVPTPMVGIAVRSTPIIACSAWTISPPPAVRQPVPPRRASGAVRAGFGCPRPRPPPVPPSWSCGVRPSISDVPRASHVPIFP